MKLYHATLTENIESIRTEGLIPQITNKISSTDENERCLISGVFGFLTKDDAVEFAENNGWWDEYTIVTFEADENEIINDPEYDGEAKFYQTNNNVEIY